jgi:hypothetical protein
MTNQPSQNLVPSEDEIEKIITQMMTTNPTSLAVTLMQIEFARFSLKILDRLRKELTTSIEQLEKNINHKL